MRVLVTGGAGFIGSHVSASLAERGDEVTILDNLSGQVHSTRASMNLPANVAFYQGSVCDRDLVSRLVSDADAVVHLAAETGTGQSMHEAQRYVDVNVSGTACLLDAIIAASHRPKRFLLASSRAVYGEGKYRCLQDGEVYPESRTHDDLSEGRWEPRCPCCSGAIEAAPTDEESPHRPLSVNGATKHIQEQLVSIIGQVTNLEWVILRFQNVYGPGQSLVNPYAGILAIFSNRLRSDLPIEIYEDGNESRDFVYIDDVVRAVELALSAAPAESVYNVGSGRAVSLIHMAEMLRSFCGSNSLFTMSGRHREGDIRHAIADVARIQRELGWRTLVPLEDGLREFIKWVFLQSPVDDGLAESLEPLLRLGLMNSLNATIDRSS